MFDYAFKDQANFDYLIEKHHYRPYQITFFKTAASLMDFRGKTVLEIGGSDTPAQIAFDELMADKWVCLDKTERHYILRNEEHFAKITIYENMDIKLDDALAKGNHMLFTAYTDDTPGDWSGKFDIVVSDCCFEHVWYLRDCLEKIHSYLKPGGSFYTCFGPIYSCKVGSHYWVNENLAFNSGLKYGLNLDYAHLLFSYGDLYKKLLPHMGALEAEKAAFEIINGERQHLSRYFYEDYEDALLDSKFSKKCMRPAYIDEPSPSDYIELSKRFPNNKRFDVYSIEMFCEKE
jgi:SAM-dependent methyltransferase